MSDKIVVPVLGESITEATVAKWLKNKGDSVEADEPVVELETDKVNLEVPSPSDGVLSEISAQNGSTVEVGAVLGSIIGGSSKNDEKLRKQLGDNAKERASKKFTWRIKATKYIILSIKINIYKYIIKHRKNAYI